MVDRTLIDKHISVRDDIHHGKPCIKGTRIPVYVILEALATGMDIETIKKEFGPITEKDIQACLLYSALLTNEQEIILQPTE